MKTMLSILAIIFSMSALAHGDIKYQIELRMSEGDAKIVSNLFDEGDITLELLAEQKSLNHVDATKQLADFFKSYPPKSCKINNQGKYNNGNRYFSGTYTSLDGKKYKATFEAVLDQDEGHYHLSSIRIEI